VLTVAVVLSPGCTRPKQQTSAPAQSSAVESAAVCSALVGSGTLETRLANVLPLELGGALYVFEGTQPSAIAKLLASLGLRQTRVVGCSNVVVVWVPGVAQDAAANLEASIVLNVEARTKERAVAPPRLASAPARSD